MSNNEPELVVVDNQSDNAEQPWHVSLEGVGTLGKGRALLNHPNRNFSTQEEAEEVAEKIRELISADKVEVEGDQVSYSDAKVEEPTGGTNHPPATPNNETTEVINDVNYPLPPPPPGSLDTPAGVEYVPPEHAAEVEYVDELGGMEDDPENAPEGEQEARIREENLM